MSEPDAVSFLAGSPLLGGRDADDLAELAGAMRRRSAAAGDVLWSEGDEARELLFVLDGEVGVSLGAPGGRAVEIGRVGPGGVLGEIGLLEGGKHTMTVRATEPTTLLTLSRHDFAALLARPDASSFELKRRLASQFTVRLRNQLRQLAETLGDEPAEGSSLGPGARGLRATGQQVPEPAGHLPRLRSGRVVGLPHVGELRDVPARAHVAR